MKKNKYLFIAIIASIALIGVSFLLNGLAKTVCLISGIVIYALSFTALVYKAIPKKEKIEDDGNRYKAKDCLLSRPEISMFVYLKNLLEPKYRIYPQLSLLSLVDKLNNTSYRNELFRIVDFVVFDNSLKPLLAIELNDASHNRSDRKERDEKVKSILTRAGINIVFIPQEMLSDEKTLRKEILKQL